MYPVLFKIGNFPVHSFGVVMVIAFIVGLIFARKRATQRGIDPNKLSDMAFWTLIVGILGARIAFILQELPYYLEHKNELFSIQFAGLTSFGGVIAAIACIVIWSRRAGWPIRTVLDVIAPAGLVMHAIGRFGCLLNGCCYGGVCDLPWAIHIDPIPQPLHPAQVYDAIMNLAAVPILLWVEKRGTSKGQIFGLTLVLHGLARFIYEFWRAGTEEQVRKGLASSTYWEGLPIPITQAQVMAGVLVLVGVGLFVGWRRSAHAQQELIAS